MTRRWLPGRLLVAASVLLAVVVLVGVAGPAGAHGYHLTANPQLSDDGTIVVESLFALSDGFVVLHADEDGAPGDPSGASRCRLGSTGA